MQAVCTWWLFTPSWSCWCCVQKCTSAIGHWALCPGLWSGHVSVFRSYVQKYTLVNDRSLVEVMEYYVPVCVPVWPKDVSGYVVIWRPVPGRFQCCKIDIVSKHSREVQLQNHVEKYIWKIKSSREILAYIYLKCSGSWWLYVTLNHSRTDSERSMCSKVWKTGCSQDVSKM